MTNTFISAIISEQKRIQKVITLTGTPIFSQPPGSLQIERRGRRLYCYEHHFTGGKRVRKQYLGVPGSDPVLSHIRDRVIREKLARLRHDQLLLEQLIEDYKDYSAESILAALPTAYQTICNGRLTEDYSYWRYQELKEWAAEDYPRNKAPYSDSENYAKDGTRTRSKGETIWYNALLDLGVLFWYDCVITITDSFGKQKTISPDFLIQCFDGTFIIIEHLGKLRDKGYALDFGEKCYWYIQENFILGKNFFVTSDDYNHGSDSQMIQAMAERVAQMFYGY